MFNCHYLLMREINDFEKFEYFLSESTFCNI